MLRRAGEIEGADAEIQAALATLRMAAPLDVPGALATLAEAAKVAIARARERLFIIAAKIGDPEYRKSFLENVPENRRTLELARQWIGLDESN